MPPNVASDLKIYSQTEMDMRIVVLAIEESLYDTFIVRSELNDPSTQNFWNKCADKVSGGLGRRVEVFELKNIWKRCESIALSQLKQMQREKAGMYNLCIQNRKVLKLLDKFPEDESEPNYREQLKDLCEKVKVLTAKVESLRSKMDKVEKDISRLKKATGNHTVVLLSDSSTENDEPAESTDRSSSD